MIYQVLIVDDEEIVCRGMAQFEMCIRDRHRCDYTTGYFYVFGRKKF